MNWEIEDPRWTAYLLGELSAEERAEAEKMLKQHPHLQQEVDSLNTVLGCLQSEISKQPLPLFEPLRKEAVLQNPSAKKSRSLWFPTAAAALLAIGFGVAHFLNPATSPTSPVPVPVSDLPLAGQATQASSDKNEVALPMTEEAEVLSDAFMSAPAAVDRTEPVMTAPAPLIIPPAELKSKRAVLGRSMAGDLESSREEKKDMPALSSVMRVEQDEPVDIQKSASGIMSSTFEIAPTPTPTPTPEPTPEPTALPEKE